MYEAKPRVILSYVLNKYLDFLQALSLSKQSICLLSNLNYQSQLALTFLLKQLMSIHQAIFRIAHAQLPGTALHLVVLSSGSG